MLGVCASAWSATVYKWVDDAGVTHYSDQPNPKAQKLQISGAQTYGSQQAAVTAPATAPAAPPPAAATPVCVIDTPGAGQVFLDVFSITGHVTLAHVSADGDQTTLRMDGQDISGLLGGDGRFALNSLDRGEHSLTLQVTNARGEVVCQATAVNFSIRQRSATAPGVPTVPGAPAAPKAPGVGVVH
ncbi:MAG TPA: DUF4124 domain-containing protein [Steroidobacteraceae bacterium]|jgi:hypothetical protein